jgi:hypothetical protein
MLSTPSIGARRATPPSFPPVDASLTGSIHVDGDGNATGGIRLPDLEVPTARHSGTNDLNPLATWYEGIPDHRIDPDVSIREHGGQVGLSNLPLVWDRR